MGKTVIQEIIAAALLILTGAASCTPSPDLEQTRVVKLDIVSVALKTVLNDAGTVMEWQNGDEISVFNDASGDIVKGTYLKGKPLEVTVPRKASRLKLVYPSCGGSFDNPDIRIPDSQSQTKAGTLNSRYYPLVAELSLGSDDTYTPVFSPSGSAFRIQAFNPSFPGEERLEGIRIESSGKTCAVTVAVPREIPAERSDGGQIYVCVEKGSFTATVFEVKTSRATYNIKTDGELDLSTDMFGVRLDLLNLRAFTDGSGDRPISNGAGFVDLRVEGMESQLTDDIIPDFSAVGYHWGETDLSDAASGYKVVELPAPSGGDDWKMIQDAIDTASEGTVLEFRPGTYIVDSIIFIDRSGIVLRGSADRATTLFARGFAPDSPSMHMDVSGVKYPSVRNFICIGRSLGKGAARVVDMSNPISADAVHADAWSVVGTTMSRTQGAAMGAGTPIVEDAFCGSSFVTVKDPSIFNPGDHVSVFRPGTQEWIHDLKMDMIIKSLKDIGSIYQWKPSEYSIWWERVVTAVRGDRIYLDAPLVMSVTSAYGGGMLYNYHWDRVRECGVENLKLVSDYDPSRTTRVDDSAYDVYHAASGVYITAAEHCWVRNVEFRHFSESAVNMADGAKNITVQDCDLYDPVAIISGGLRYGYHISHGAQCLVKNCSCDKDRHQFVTAQKSPGPNVFTRCTATNAYSTLGPHQRWATGILWDNVSTNSRAGVYDAGNGGTGQGWQGTNIVFWNCRIEGVINAQSPWVTGKNYVIGCYSSAGPATLTPKTNYANPGYAPDGSIVYDRDVNGPRPDAVCRPLEPGEPASLYEYQLERRLASGLLISKLAL